MTEQPGLEFAGLLRQLRARARLTQEELAEAASLSPRSVSDLERGIHITARIQTAELLAAALGGQVGPLEGGKTEWGFTKLSINPTGQTECSTVV